MIAIGRKFPFKILVIALLMAFCLGPTSEPSPVWKGETLPEPPMQRAAWSAPKVDLPADLLAATTRLFEQGLADPRAIGRAGLGEL